MITSQISEYMYDLRGLSTDDKPDKTNYKEVRYGNSIGFGHPPANGSAFFEMDTSKAFMYDEENDVWLELS